MWLLGAMLVAAGGCGAEGDSGQNKGTTGRAKQAEKGKGELSMLEGKSKNYVMLLADLCESFRWVSC